MAEARGWVKSAAVETGEVEKGNGQVELVWKVGSFCCGDIAGVFIRDTLA